MRNEFGENVSPVRAANPRPNRWVPVEVWQSKGLTAQEMTLPQGKLSSRYRSFNRNLKSFQMFRFKRTQLTNRKFI